MKKLFIFFAGIFSFFHFEINAQSMNCGTATQLTLNNGSVCTLGTNVGAVSNNILFGACNATPVNMVWYTYVTNGSNNSFTLAPGTLSNPEIVIYLGGCPNTGTLQNCVTAVGNNTIVTSWGMGAGVQVWIGIASTSLNDGTFQFCVNSQPPAPGVGNVCSTAIPICSTVFTQPNMANSSSGQTPICFANPTQQDMWIKFSIRQAGTLAWTAMPNNPITEFDWTLWDITAGCPGVVTCCNYNFASGSSLGFGMQNQAGNVACGFNLVTGVPQSEFSPAMTVNCGRIYALQISNYSNNNTGFSLSFVNSTCLITSNSLFGVTPTLVCGPNLNAVISNSSTGACDGQIWNFGDGSPIYNGLNPPPHTYTSPGTYAITASIGGVCPATSTKFVQLLAPLAATVAPGPISCAGQCNGTASVTSMTGGDGVYSFLWSNGSTANNISGLCAGVYSVTISNAQCGSSITRTVNVVAPPALSITASSTGASCADNLGSITVSAAGGTPTYSYSINGGAFSAATNYNNLAPGTYTMGAIDSQGCQTSTTISIVPNQAPNVIVNSPTVCAGMPAVLTASGATTYSWSPATGLNTTTGGNVVATLTTTTTYTIVGTIGSCATSGTAIVSIYPAPSPTATSNSPICINSDLNLFGGGGQTYTWTGPANYNSTSQNPVLPAASASNAGTYTLAITDANGCSNTTTTDVVLNPLPALTVNHPTACAGGNLSFSGSGANNYAWTGPMGYSSGIPNPMISNVTASMSGQYTLVGTSSQGCTNIAISNAAVTDPNAIITSNSPVCIGGTLLLNGAGGGSYSWSGPNGFISSAQSNTISNLTMAEGGNYSLLVTLNTCTSQAFLSVIIHPLPSPSVSVNSPVCANSSANFTATGGSIYEWTGPSGYTASGPNPVIPYVNFGNAGVYSLTCTDNNGCVNTTAGTLVVKPMPSLSASGSTVCVGQTAYISAVSDGVSYNWTGPNNFSSSLANNSIPNATEQELGYYTVVVTGSNQCTASAAVRVDNFPQPEASASNNGPACLHSEVKFSASGGMAYSWAGPNGFVSNVANPILPNVNSLIFAGTYTLTVIDSNGCVASALTLLTIKPIPTASLNTSANRLCVPFCSQFSINSSSPLQMVKWTTNDNHVLEGTTYQYCFNKAGEHQIKADFKDIYGCSNSSSISLTAYPIPVADFVFDPGGPMEKEEVNFKDGSRGPEINSWSWYFASNHNISYSQNPNFIFENPGTYPVALVVTNKWNCKDTVVKPIVIAEDFTIFVPNAFTPNNDGTNDYFQAKGYGIKKYKLMVFDRWGEKLFETEDFLKGWDGSFKGQACKDDTYTWKISVQGANGKNKDLVGIVTLVR
jgi:gliding motility-associated-like protein